MTEVRSGRVFCWDCEWEDDVQEDVERDIFCQNCGSTEIEFEWHE